MRSATSQILVVRLLKTHRLHMDTQKRRGLLAKQNLQ
ncbi:hypothetical protein N803_11740 [Knoellia subterranea KCTC 19937]|uniref:Uncharacterized protein n=1 Tax=Knoellia subterranea KCTC 19937 TaxID=1385521 RepID=A0A0A0JKT3_9MICO|nr:hypothetical protein N803_11740 [Knoellia subterranea KCTC 19937]